MKTGICVLIWQKMATAIEQLKADCHRFEFGEKHSAGQKEALQIRKKSTKLKNEIRNAKNVSSMEHPRISRRALETVALYACMSQKEPNPSLHHALIFDVVKPNVGDGYDEFSGMFTAPSPGVYVSTWTIYKGNHGQTRFHKIYVNHDVFDTTYGETDNNHSDYDSDSGSMAVSLNASHHVYFRSAMSCTTFVHSNNNFARSTFAGKNLC